MKRKEAVELMRMVVEKREGKSGGKEKEEKKKEKKRKWLLQ